MVFAFEDTGMEISKIQQYYAGSTIFITGGTGFLGKLLLEKLLRSCTDIKKIYLLIREKKGKNAETRLEEILNDIFFDALRRKQPQFAEKISIISGDCVLPDLGINDDDKAKLFEEVNCVFHCAATVNFSEKIRIATHINVRSCKDLLNMARKMKELQSFVYVSTAYSYCVRKEISEELYEPPLKGEKLITLVDTLNDDLLDAITPTLLGQWPNTYSYTKAVAEDTVNVHGKGLPLAIVRPSIVVSTVNEPLAGWIDNMYGATGVTIGAAVGLIRTLHCKKEKIADIVPADYVINCIIAVGWEIGTTKNVINKEIIDHLPTSKEKATERDIPIYNYVSSTQTHMTWKLYMKYAEIYLKQVPSPQQVWHYCFFLNSNYYIHMLCILLLHRLPAYIVDFVAFCLGKEQRLVKGYQKIDKFMNVISYFSTREWKFTDNNTKALWTKIDPEDRKTYNFSLTNFDWDSYFYTYARGARVYLVKDPLETMPQGRVKYLKLQISHYALVTILSLAFLKLFMILWNTIF